MTSFEYKIVELDVPPDVLAISSDPDIRSKINPVIEDTLNEYGKDGWQLHMSGLTSMPTVILQREKTRRRRNSEKKVEK